MIFLIISIMQEGLSGLNIGRCYQSDVCVRNALSCIILTDDFFLSNLMVLF